ncbi:hypothetical protein P389DRAFT_98607 [Cystobasidium minutum MCA 4210]|uniref:uncharacterized protein n=1 Tax=Cystobasidium minutum MCA 4210 TaxID=1397322 RepID=UPI0034CFF8FA|eukprot:jgi/Rhomi1/98607/CE98606_3162
MMSEHDNDGEFASVVWDTPEAANQSAAARKNHSSSGAGEPSSSTSGEAVTTANTDQDYTSSHGIGTSSLQRAGSTASNNAAAAGIGGASHADAGGAGGSGSGSNTGRYWVKASVVEPVKMLEGTKDAYVAYNVKGETNLPQYASPTFTSRRRFQDFLFLHDHLAKDFPACVVPPLPGKHRLEYLKGDRFGPEFVEKRSADLNRFLHRLTRHPTLARSTLLQDFLESTEWNIRMHQRIAHPPVSPDSATSGPASIIDSLSDTLLNAFTKVRKPDERFLEVRDNLDKFEGSLVAIERTEARARTRIGDLANDYEDFAASIQGLGYLESGITEPLARLETSMLDFAQSLRTATFASTETFLAQLHSLITYAHSFRALLKLRDQKQSDFEELSAYLSNLSNERDRLANGYSVNSGIGSYFKDKVESLRGGDADISREAKMRKLDNKIKELQEAVNAAHDTSIAFDEEVLREHRVFQAAKRAELKELFSSLANGHIAHYEKAMDDMAKCQPFLESIRVS